VEAGAGDPGEERGPLDGFRLDPPRLVAVVGGVVQVARGDQLALPGVGHRAVLGMDADGRAQPCPRTQRLDQGGVVGHDPPPAVGQVHLPRHRSLGEQGRQLGGEVRPGGEDGMERHVHAARPHRLLPSSAEVGARGHVGAGIREVDDGGGATVQGGRAGGRVGVAGHGLPVGPGDVDMGVDPAGKDQAAGGVDLDLGRAAVERIDARHPALPDADAAFEFPIPLDDPRVANDEVVFGQHRPPYNGRITARPPAPSPREGASLRSPARCCRCARRWPRWRQGGHRLTPPRRSSGAR
jgi:hypothetical protein